MATKIVAIENSPTQVDENPKYLLVCAGRSVMLSRATDFALVVAVLTARNF